MASRKVAEGRIAPQHSSSAFGDPGEDRSKSDSSLGGHMPSLPIRKRRVPIPALASLAASLVVAAGCNSTAEPVGYVTFRVFNASSAPLDVVTYGHIGQGNAQIPSGGNSYCIVRRTDSILVTLRLETGAVLGLPPAMQPGGHYTVVAADGFAGVTDVHLISTVPRAGLLDSAMLQLFHAASGTVRMDLFATTATASLLELPGLPPQTARVANVGYGDEPDYFQMPQGTARRIRLTETGWRVALLDAGMVTIAREQKATLFVLPPLSGSPGLRSRVLIDDC
jgi:hypothetical protein